MPEMYFRQPASLDKSGLTYSGTIYENQKMNKKN